MGRPIKSAKTGNTGAAVNTALPQLVQVDYR